MLFRSVGASEGPDFDYLRRLRVLAPGATLIAAGGARHVQDLECLRTQGVAAVLLATALHDGSLSSNHVRGLLRTAGPA